MLKSLRGLAAATVLTAGLGLAGLAHAQSAVKPDQSYNLTPFTLEPGHTSTVDTQSAPAGSSVYDFAFNLDGTYGTTASGNFTISANEAENFTDANLELFSGTPTDYADATYITGVDYDPATQPQQTLSAVLQPGNYFVQAKVQVPKGDTGPFTVQATVKSISKAPEPSTWLLMMAGVGGLGLALRRRRDAADLAAA